MVVDLGSSMVSAMLFIDNNTTYDRKRDTMKKMRKGNDLCYDLR